MGSHQRASSVRGFQRLVVLSTVDTNVQSADLPEISFCDAHKKCTAVPCSITGAVCPVACEKGEYLLLFDTSAEESEDDVDEEGYSETPLACVYKLLERRFNRDLLGQSETPQQDGDGRWTGGALQKNQRIYGEEAAIQGARHCR